MPGKAKHWSWQYFDSSEEVVNGKKKVIATCKFCPAHYNGNATEMAYHLTHQCKKIGEETRKNINRLAGIKQKSEEPPSKMAKKTESSTPCISNYFDRVTEVEQAELDILLTRAFSTGNIAANFLENPFFQQFVSKLHPSYKLPTRKYRYPKVLIPAQFERVKSNLAQAKQTF